MEADGTSTEGQKGEQGTEEVDEVGGRVDEDGLRG